MTAMITIHLVLVHPAERDAQGNAEGNGKVEHVPQQLNAIHGHSWQQSFSPVPTFAYFAHAVGTQIVVAACNQKKLR